MIIKIKNYLINMVLKRLFLHFKVVKWDRKLMQVDLHKELTNLSILLTQKLKEIKYL